MVYIYLCLYLYVYVYLYVYLDDFAHANLHYRWHMSGAPSQPAGAKSLKIEIKTNKYIAQRKQTMKIVFLDSKTIGDDIDLSEYDKLGRLSNMIFRQQRKQRSAQEMQM